MAQNKGKQFEQKVREAFEKVDGVSIDRIPDQTMRHKGARNICDFIVYKKPHEYYIECKSVHGNILPFNNISESQWQGLLEKSKIPGVFAGIICWWVDKDVTLFIPINVLQIFKLNGCRSMRYDAYSYDIVPLEGKKKRVFFDYDMEQFLRRTAQRRWQYEIRDSQRRYQTT